MKTILPILVIAVAAAFIKCVERIEVARAQRQKRLAAIERGIKCFSQQHTGKK